jgi:solute carrier family 25 iron transporter 28/37
VLYKSFPTTLAMNIPYGCLMVAVNESMRKFLSGRNAGSTAEDGGRHSLSTLLISGSVAGGVASFFTTPLDIIKTRLQVQSLQPCPRFPTVQNVTPTGVIRSFSTVAVGVYQKSRGPVHIVKDIIREEGMRGFFRGAVPRMMVHIPSVAVSWTTYDMIKRLLSADSGDD